MSIYLLVIGDDEEDVWFIPMFFLNKKAALEHRNTYYPKLKVIKFVSNENEDS